MFKKYLKKLSDIFFDFQYKISRILINIEYCIDGIKNVISYIPIIYNNRDWDYIYFIDLIEFKLKKIKKLFTECQIAEGDELIPSQVDEVLQQISKYRETSFGYNFEQEQKEFEKIFDMLKKYLQGWWN